MKRFALTFVFVVGIAVSAGACTPITGGVGTACQGNAHAIVCR